MDALPRLAARRDEAGGSRLILTHDDKTNAVVLACGANYRFNRALGLVPWDTRPDVPSWARDIRLCLTLHGMHWSGYTFNTSAQPDHSVSPLLPEAERNYYSLGLGWSQVVEAAARTGIAPEGEARTAAMLAAWSERRRSPAQADPDVVITPWHGVLIPEEIR